MTAHTAAVMSDRSAGCLDWFVNKIQRLQNVLLIQSKGELLQLNSLAARPNQKPYLHSETTCTRIAQSDRIYKLRT